MPDLRLDPVTGRRVYVAEERAGRPHDYDEAAGEERVESPAARREHCPFCAGHEHITPDAAAEALGPDGRWRVRVLPSRWPAVAATGPARGVHEVIVESPDHVAELGELSAEQFAAALAMHRDRLRACSQRSDLAAAIIFKNSGHRAGASLEHIHSQLIAFPEVPEQLAVEVAAAAAHRTATGRCLLCDLVERELAAGERFLCRHEGFVALAAYAGRQPYETWILPAEHAADFAALDDAGCRAAAESLQRLVAALVRVSPGAAYNLILHTAPFASSGEPHFHWHWELIPRLAHFAGLELGTGVYVNPLAPERAAEQLRAALK